MRGIQKIRIKNKNVDFKIELHRNITVVRGNSGTGKTTLFNLISEYARYGADSGIILSADKNCIALIDTDWENQLINTKDSIVFVDEGYKYIYSKEFANAIKKTDNYYVLFIRENLHELPYSVEEIYEIKTSGKLHTFKKMYTAGKGYIYGGKGNEYSILITEDSKAGYQFYDNYFKNSDISCCSADNNSGIYKWLSEHIDQKVFVVADGAAFGSEMNRIMELKKRYPDNITICLPESFEWLILKSGLLTISDLGSIIENPSDYIDCEKYFSWEQFFVKYLVEQTKNTHMKYSKSSLGKFYMIENNAKKVVAVIML